MLPRRLAATLGAVLLLTTAASWLLVRWGAIVDADRQLARYPSADPSGPDLGGALGEAFQWALWVTALAAVCWLATRAARHAWQPAAVGAAAIVGWATAALSGAWSTSVTWPGPRRPLDWDVFGYAQTTTNHPGALSVLVVLGAVVATSVSAARTPRGARVDTPRGGSGAVAVLVTVGPGVIITLGVVVAVTSEIGDLSYFGPALHPIASSMALVGAAVVASGSGRAGLAVLLAAGLMFAQPMVALWSSGGPDTLLAAGVGSVVGAALAWAWRPLARSLRSLAVDPVPPGA